jgi:hypothetical protein
MGVGAAWFMVQIKIFIKDTLIKKDDKYPTNATFADNKLKV